MIKQFTSILMITLLFSSCFLTKERTLNSRSQQKPTGINNNKDTIKAVIPGKFKSYAEVVTKKAVSKNGMIKIHKIDERYFFEIPDSLMGKDLLIVNRISKGAVGAAGDAIGFAGDQINENVVQFAKGPNDKIFIKSISYTERSADSTASGMYRSLLNSGLQPIIAVFDIKAIGKDSNAVVIDMTDYLNSDNEVLFFDSKTKSVLKVGGMQGDKSYVVAVNPYPNNVEIKTTKTYGKPMQQTPFGQIGGGNVTYELNSSIVLLPKQLMRSRSSDNRVGYFTTGYTDFDANPQGVKQSNMITRWRLEPKVEDKQKYLSGELVEPVKPIVFYIDPATPKQWVPFLILGINDWNVAFEAAGFKKAIIAKEAPTKAQDSTWSIDDARHNAIVYKPSALANASGPHVHDPRTGEILETHVNWYHNVMQLLRNWYLIQAGATDPRARNMKLDDELMGQLIRFVSGHEIGHTLGLRHNFGSSSSVPVEKLRDKAWVEANGHTPSIMDYARFNYVAQPEDHISEKGIFPRIGDYDKWAIEWGYRWWPELPKNQEASKMNAWIIERTNDKRLWFGEESDPDDPRCQGEDLGDNAMTASLYGIKNLKRILPNMLSWSKIPNESFESTNDMYRELLKQFSRYMKHVSKNIGGIMTSPKAVEEKGAVVEYVSRSKQKEAMVFLQEQLFNTPLWLLNNNIFEKTGSGSILTISRQQDAILLELLSANTLYKLLQFEGFNRAKAYTASGMLSDLQDGIFSELETGRSITIYRRNLQKSYTEKLMTLLAATASAPPGLAQSGPDIKTTDIPSIVKMQLTGLRSRIKLALSKSADKMTRAHLQDINQRIEQVLKINRSWA